MKIYQGDNEIASDNELLKIIDLREVNEEIVSVSVILTIDNILKIKVNDNLITEEIKVNNNLVESKGDESNYI